tara:strand:+ start:187 stop:939 length:753 start_codon:yes stop_codon:yes gene_type:complete
MKKKLESELISLAHRVLKLTGKEDLAKMQKEVALLYQKITILKFFKEQFNGELPDDLSASASFFSSLTADKHNKDSAKEEGIKNNEDKDEAIMEPAIEKIKDIVAQMPQETLEVDEIVDEINKKINDDGITDLEETLGQLPMFEPVETAGPKEEAEEEPSLSTMEKVSLDENLKTGEFNIGLNDRLAFVNHLFENNNEDYDRVLSQLTTMDSFEEISDFIENIIKPDYNNWDDKADYESRFLEIIEKKFK